MGYSIDNWLSNQQRQTGSFDFTIFDVSEHSPRTAFTLELLKELLSRFFFDPQVLKDLRSVLGETAKLALDAATPSTPSLRAGAFGEAISAEISERWHAYLIPLRRLRVTGGSPPGTDLLALRVGEQGRLQEVCYIESKLRTTRSLGAALDAYEQLRRTRQERFPIVSQYVVNYLAATNSPLYEAFVEYLASRASQPATDSYRIALTWDDSSWTEEVLKNLEDKGVELTPLSIDVVRLAELRDLINVVYDSLGVEVMNDDD